MCPGGGRLLLHNLINGHKRNVQATRILGPHPLVELVSPLGAAGFLFFLGGPVASVFAWLGLPSVRCWAVSAVCPYAFRLFPVASVAVVLRVCLCARVLGCCICLACCCCTVY